MGLLFLRAKLENKVDTTIKNMVLISSEKSFFDLIHYDGCQEKLL